MFFRNDQHRCQRRLEGATEIRHFIVHSAIGGLIALVQITAFVGLMTFYSLRMTQIFLILVPIYIGLMYFSAKILKPAFDDIQENEARYRMLQKDIVNGIQTVKAAAAEGSFRDIVLKNFHNYPAIKASVNLIFPAMMEQFRHWDFYLRYYYCGSAPNWFYMINFQWEHSLHSKCLQRCATFRF